VKKQQVSADLQRVVVETLARLGRAFAERDVDAAVACFTPDGAAYGDDLEDCLERARHAAAWFRGDLGNESE